MPKILNPADKIIVALDGMQWSEITLMLAKLPELRWVKVGLELFVSEGPEVLLALRNQGLKVFLDLKFHDIPITMSGACKKAAKTGVELITVHACSGVKALSEAQASALEGAAESGLPAPTLLAVTVLTSWDQKRLSEELLVEQALQSRVEWLASLAVKSGLGGCVCSPLEVKSLRRIYPEPFELITPGIRIDRFNLDDQSRVMSPCAAIKAGASRIVIGRPITRDPEPEKVFKRLCRDIIC